MNLPLENGEKSVTRVSMVIQLHSHEMYHDTVDTGESQKSSCLCNAQLKNIVPLNIHLQGKMFPFSGPGDKVH
jgi:hypothetical protein